MAVLNPEINKIPQGSALETLYKRLLQGFKQAQTETMPDFTGPEYVIQNGTDYIVDTAKINKSILEYKDIAIHNSAYLLASSIVGDIGDGSGGGSDTDGSTGLFVPLSGGSMTGKLNTLYGFASGDDGVKILDVYRTKEPNLSERKNIVKIDGELHLNPNGLFVNGSNVLSYNNSKLTLSGNNIELNGIVKSNGEITVGNVHISSDGIMLLPNDNVFYHSGNSNRNDVDWSMFNGVVGGSLSVVGKSIFGGTVEALNGFKLGINSKALVYCDNENEVIANTDLKVVGVYKLKNDVVLSDKDGAVSLSAPNKSLNLGDNKTKQINLIAGIYDNAGVLRLVSEYGDGNFPNSFQASHQRGGILIHTYRNSQEDEGVVIDKWLRFGSHDGVGVYGFDNGLEMLLPFRYMDNTGVFNVISKKVSLSVKDSDSLFTPLNKKSSSLFFATDNDFYVFDKAIETFSIGIAKTKTRLAKNQLFFDDSVYLQGLADGIKHYGNVYITGSIGTERFSSGFAGNGWQIETSKLTGNANATFDELTVRKKMRLYELEVQKQSVANGSLWVSDSCSGDYVISIA